MMDEVVVDEWSGRGVWRGERLQDGGKEGKGGLRRGGVSHGDDSTETIEDLPFVSTVEELLDLLGREGARSEFAWDSGIASCLESEVACWMRVLVGSR